MMTANYNEKPFIKKHMRNKLFKKVLQNLKFSKRNFLKKFCKILNSLKVLAKSFRKKVILKNLEFSKSFS